MSEKEYTLEELAQKDGKEGRPAFFATDGVVYDATGSRLWREGTHVRVHHAGRDLSGEIMVAPHGKSRLDLLPRVGVLVEEAVREEEPPIPALAKLAYKLHAHPASVHFPIALCAVASLLHLVGLLVECPECRTVSWWNLVLGVGSSPLPIASGFLDWVYQFGGRPTRLFVAKIGLSAVFLALGVFTLALGSAHGGGGLLFDVMVLAFAPLVLALGFIGGRITFPS